MGAMSDDPTRRQALADAALFPVLRLALHLNDGPLVAADGKTVLLTEEGLEAMERIAEELHRTADCYDRASIEESFELLVARAEPRGILNDAWALVASHGIPALTAEVKYRYIE